MCPYQIRKPNIKTTCNNERATCNDGNCTGSLCALADSQPCTLLPIDMNNLKILCQISCTTRTGDCVSLNRQTLGKFQEFKKIHEVVGNVAVLYKPIGFPCNKSSGVCDMLSYCRDPTPDGPLATLANILLGGGPISLKDFMKKYWFASVVIMLFPLMFFLCLLQLCDIQIGYIDNAVDKLSKISESFSQLSLNKTDSRVASRPSCGKYKTKSRLKLNRVPAVAKSAVSKLSKSKSLLVLDKIRKLLDKEILWKKAEEDVYKLSVRVRKILFSSFRIENSSLNEYNEMNDADKEYLNYVIKTREDSFYILKNPFEYLWYSFLRKILHYVRYFYLQYKEKLSKIFRKRSSFVDAEENIKVKKIKEISKKYFDNTKNRQEVQIRYQKRYDKFDVLSFI